MSNIYDSEYRWEYLDHLRSIDTKLDEILESLMELLDKRHKDDDFEQRVQNIWDHYLYVIGEKNVTEATPKDRGHWHHLPDKPNAFSYCIVMMKDNESYIPTMFFENRFHRFLINCEKFSCEIKPLYDDQVDRWCSFVELAEMLDKEMCDDA